MSTQNMGPEQRRLGRMAVLTGSVLLAAGVAIPTVAGPAVAAIPVAPAVETVQGHGGDGQQTNGYRGVQVEVKNRTHSKVIYVKDRNSGQVKMIPGGGSATWAEPHKAAHDEVELAAYYDHRVDAPGIELDGANGKAWWPTFSVDGDVENFSTDEMKVFNPGDGGRYVVTRIGDSDDHKRFVVEVTPPGPIEKAAPAKAPKPKPAAPAERAIVTQNAAVTVPTASAPAEGQVQQVTAESKKEKPGFFDTRGTHVGVQNTGDQPIWIQKYWPGPPGKWSTPVKVMPGEWTSHSGDYPMIDDCEMRVFFSEADAREEENNIDIDGENPAGTSPWLSVDWDSEYFKVGGKHTWITDEGHRFEGERVSDSATMKEFRLKITPR